MLITADKIFDGEQFLVGHTLEIKAGKIAAIYPEVLDNATKLPGVLTAGFIDYHVNGGGGKLFNFNPQFETLTTMINAHAQFGTTAILPTLITDGVDVMASAADAVAQAIANNQAGILGIHFEGPHLSEPKKGVHDSQYIRPLTEQEKAIFSRSDLGIKLITLAPENVSNDEIKALLGAGVKVSIGHSNASFEVANTAVELGVDGFTHLFNAMSPFTSREPGVLGAALACDKAYCGIILDGHHMHYAAAKVAYAAKAKGKLLLVTDAMSTIGSSETCFELFGQQVQLNGDKLTTPEGTLAGSALTMVKAVENAVKELGLGLEEALRMASLYPAQYLSVDNIMGSISVGKQADLTCLTDDFSIEKTWLKGELIYSR